MPDSVLMLIATLQTRVAEVRRRAADGERGYGLIEFVITVGALAAAALIVKALLTDTVRSWAKEWSRK